MLRVDYDGSNTRSNVNVNDFCLETESIFTVLEFSIVTDGDSWFSLEVNGRTRMHTFIRNGSYCSECVTGSVPMRSDRFTR